MAAPITTAAYSIRYATQSDSDITIVLSLLRELAEYEKEHSSCKTTKEILLKTLSFPISPSASTSSSPTPTEVTARYARTLLISPNDGKDTVVGIAVYFPIYSTWTGPSIYIEDMIITASQRGKGYGKALLSALAREVGGAEGVKGVNEYSMGWLHWSGHKWNKPSIDLFSSDNVGAFIKVEYIGCQVEREKLVALAGRWGWGWGWLTARGCSYTINTSCRLERVLSTVVSNLEGPWIKSAGKMHSRTD